MKLERLHASSIKHATVVTSERYSATLTMDKKLQLNIGFIHPDLGLGGAERLIIDAALYLQEANHRVTIFTAHHDHTRCFDETRDGTLDVRVFGNFLPLHVRQRLRAPCAIVRMASVACAMTLGRKRFDVIFCDLVPHAMPLLRLFSRAKLIYYCHFPDQLLTPRRHLLYQCYRQPIDWLEAKTTGMADRILVNSRFTAAMFHQTFPRLRSITPEVLYPSVDTSHIVPTPTVAEDGQTLTILSLNRYEHKKNIGLAVEALALLREKLSADIFNRVQLIIAGSYDERLQENRATLRELQQRVGQLQLDEQVVFIRSCTDTERLALLHRCLCVVYTPENEHFGLVPIEAMAAARPVVAVSSGGPLETIQHAETGLLCDPTPDAFATGLASLLTDRKAAERMGQAGRAHVARHFSRAVFGTRLAAMVDDLMQPNR